MYVCDNLSIPSKADGKGIHQRMRNLLLLSNNEDFDKFKSAIGIKFPAATKHLNRAWLPYAHKWRN